jgi:hypothetical protein
MTFDCNNVLSGKATKRKRKEEKLMKEYQQQQQQEQKAKQLKSKTDSEVHSSGKILYQNLCCIQFVTL